MRGVLHMEYVVWGMCKRNHPPLAYTHPSTKDFSLRHETMTTETRLTLTDLHELIRIITSAYLADFEEEDDL